VSPDRRVATFLCNGMKSQLTKGKVYIAAKEQQFSVKTSGLSTYSLNAPTLRKGGKGCVTQRVEDCLGGPSLTLLQRVGLPQLSR
jgi:hypothetical protein